jgi:GNAT superfamily N-acetyltransferase
MPVARAATSEDLNGLVALCRAAVGPDDYVLRYLEGMVAAGRIRVATEGDRVVAMMGVTPCVDGSLWLGQIRSHPDVRRRGYARFLVETVAEQAARDGRPALRLWASEGNRPSRRLAEGTGFRSVAVFVRLLAKAVGGASGLRPRRTVGGALRRWEESLFHREGGGYVGYRWSFVPLDPETLSAIAAEGEMLEGPKAAILLWRGGEEAADVAGAAFLAGGVQAMFAARRAAHARGFRRVAVFVPRHPRILAWARDAGYERGTWGTRAVLYERRLAP